MSTQTDKLTAIADAIREKDDVRATGLLQKIWQHSVGNRWTVEDNYNIIKMESEKITQKASKEILEKIMDIIELYS